MSRAIITSIAAAGLALAALVAGAAPAAAQAGCGPTVIVQFGETMRAIAQRCGTTVDAIMQANPRIPNAFLLLPGQRLQMPAPPPPPVNVIRYTVRPGETLRSISRGYSIPLADIYRLNPDIDAATLRAGDVIFLPGGIAPPPPPPPPPALRYTVRGGDTLRSIARDNGTTVGVIVGLNPGIDARPLRRGDVVLLPAGSNPPPPPPPVNTNTYVVRPGDTLSSIARANSMTLAQLYELNPRLDPARLRVGDVVIVRGGVVPPPPQPGPAPALDAAVSPGSGPIGAVVQVSASGFPASRQLNLLAGARIATLQQFQTVTTDRNGNATLSVRIPDWAAAQGTLVFAFETADGRLRAVTDAFRVSAAPPPPSGTVRVIGTITREGIECQAMRGDDGKLYTLTGNLGDVRPGDRVRVDGRVAQASVCQQGTTIDVTRIGAAPN